MNSIIFYFVLLQLGERPTLGPLCCFLWYTLSVFHDGRRRGVGDTGEENDQSLCA